MKKLIIFFSIIIINACLGSENPKYDKWNIPSFFRGFNVLNETPKTLKDFLDLKNTGANLAQLGCFGFQEVDSPYVVNENNIADTDSLVSYCRQAGIYYTISVRQGPGRRDVYIEGGDPSLKSTIWFNVDEQQLYAQMLKNIAKRYEDDTLFVGLVMIMEPNPLYDSLQFFTNPDTLQGALDYYGIDMKNIFELMIDTIRTVDEMLPLSVQNVAYSTSEYFSILEAQDDPYIIYEFHNYWPYEFTHAEFSNTMTYPGVYFSITYFSYRYYNKNFLNNVTFDQVKDFQNETGAPIFLGEFGLMYPQNGGPLFLRDVYEIATEHDWHFALWNYRGYGLDTAWNYEIMGGEYWSTVLDMFSDLTNVNYSVTNLLPQQYSLSQNYPNPFNPTTKINFSIPKDEHVSINIYDIVGKKVLSYINNELKAGNYELTLETSNLSSGVYFYQLLTPAYRETKRMQVMK